MATRPTDNIAKRKAYKEKVFGTKKTTIDGYTSKRLNKKNAHVDHVIPIQTIKENHPELSTAQLKRVSNITNNYVITDGKLNMSKGASSNSEYAIRQMYNSKSKMDFETAANMITKEHSSKRAVKEEIRAVKREASAKKFKELFKKK